MLPPPPLSSLVSRAGLFAADNSHLMMAKWTGDH